MLDNPIKIVTHSGTFHADDIFAVATLLIFLGDKKVTVTRTRDEVVIKDADYVVDVGGVYNPERNRFDHHQIGGAGMRENGISYASFGLVWKKYGLGLCSGNPEVFEKIDQILVQPVDATDNGFKLVEPNIPGVYPYDIGLFLNTFNPGFNETKENVDAIFMEVVELAQKVFKREIFIRLDLIKVKVLLEDIYNKTEDKRLIVLDSYYPTSDFLSKYPEPLFVIFPADDGNWTMKAVRVDSNSFGNRKDLPASWAGKSGDELEKVTGVSGAVFCHTGRFIAVAKTKEAIQKLAEIALKE